jgi:heme/copper-type cytochrome/quinol oxidase subunit 4
MNSTFLPADSSNSNVYLSFLLYSLPLFALAYLVSYGLKMAAKNYLQQQYTADDLALDEREEELSDTQNYIHQNLYNLSIFALSLYLIAAPFLLHWLTLGFSRFLLPFVVFSGFIQLVLALVAHSNERKMQANISIMLFILWLGLVFLFIDFGIRN